MADLQVWTDGEDWVVAESAEDAVAVMMEIIGTDDPAEITEASKWKVLANDKTLRVTVDDDPAEHHIKTCAEQTAEARAQVAEIENQVKGFDDLGDLAAWAEQWKGSNVRTKLPSALRQQVDKAIDARAKELQDQGAQEEPGASG